MWYTVKLLYQCLVKGRKDKIVTCDECIVVFKSNSAENAYKKARRIGNREETSYKNIYNQTVYWQFLGIQELCEILDRKIADGTEVFSILSDKKEPRKNIKKFIPPKKRLRVFLYKK